MGKKNLSADETKKNWIKYYEKLDYSGRSSPFFKELKKYAYKHSWYNSLRTVIELTGLKSGDVILDAGSGWGRMVIGLIERTNGLSITMLDLSMPALEIAKSVVCSGKENRNFKMIGGNLENLPLKDNTYDVVYSARVFQHLNDPSKGAKEIIRVLKPGGRFAIFLQNKLCPLNLTYYSRLYSPRQVKFWFNALSYSFLRVRSMDFYPGFLTLLPVETRMGIERLFEKTPWLNLFGGKVVAWGTK